VSSFVSNDLALGFLVANAALVTFGLLCWALPVRSGWRAASGLIWFWTILELGSGIAHAALFWASPPNQLILLSTLARQQRGILNLNAS
jgi:hypothetical protein